MEFEKIILIAFVILLSSVLQGVAGFAFMLFAMPLVSFILDIKAAVPLLALLSFSMALIYWVSVFRLSRGRQFEHKEITPLFISAPFGIPIGIFFLIQLDGKLIKLALGVLLILYSAYSLFNRRTIFRLPNWTGYIFGFLSGILGGAMNIGGPPVVLYLSAKNRLKIDTVSPLSLFFLANSTLIMLFHIGVGHITRDVVVMFLKIVPAEFIGMLLGTYIFKRMSEDKYRKVLFVLLIVMGVMLMI